MLPQHVPPMLARLGDAFDSDDHLFEVKWDGTRAITLVDGGGRRMHNRKLRDMKPRYPEFSFLDDIEMGLVLDGEVVILDDDGKPSFRGMLQREQGRDPMRIANLARSSPANYVVFDLLYRGGKPLLDRPLTERRAELAEVVAAISNPRLVLSEGVVGAGLDFFEQIRELNIEGMMAKDLTSPYRPGARTPAWVKVKPVQNLQCVIIGYQLRERELRSLIIAASIDGKLRCVGRVGSGMTASHRAEILPLLMARHRDTPLVDCNERGFFVEPTLFCQVSYLELSKTGLRAPVFQGLIDDVQ